MGLFLGAGASFELGMPLAWDLTNEITHWLTPDKLRELNHGWRGHRTGYAEAVIDDCANVLADGGMHYEAKLGYLQTQQRRSRELAQDYHGLYSWLVELVYMLLYQRHVLNVKYITRALRFYRGLVDLANAHRPLWVFSLNHDVLLECIAAAYDIPLSAGLSEASSLPCRLEDGSPAGELAIESRLIADIEKAAFNFPTSDTRTINLLKLHGALDLFVADDAKLLVRILPRETTPARIIEALKIANENLFYEAFGQRVKTTNEISYADRGGKMQFLRRSLLAGAYKFDRRASQVLPEVMLAQFRSCLNYVTELACIGYGFGDAHINDALRNWLEFSATRRLICIAPCEPQVPSFLMHLRPQVSCENLTATEFFERFSSEPLTTFERMMRSGLQGVRSRMRAHSTDAEHPFHGIVSSHSTAS
jgi:hypothetical protein